MEYRLYIRVPDLPFEEEKRWQPFADLLNADFAEYGPVISWSGSDIEVIIALVARDQAAAVHSGVGVIGQALRRVGRGDLYPHRVEVEEVNADCELSIA